MRNEWKESYQAHMGLNYKKYWDIMIEQINSEEFNHYFWLQSHAGYLFKMENICWGMDINFRNKLAFEQTKGNIKKDLSCLKFIIITHGHSDHFDTRVMNELSSLPIYWIIPDFLREKVTKETTLAGKNIIWAKEGVQLNMQGLTIEAFRGLHWHDGKFDLGLDSLGYIVSAGGKKFMFPGDVRDYSSDKIPCPKDVDYLFHHVWLGKENALNYPWERYLHKSCKFISDINPDNVFLTHLYDTTRTLEDMWVYSHCAAIMDELINLNPAIDITIPRLGKGYRLY